MSDCCGFVLSLGLVYDVTQKSSFENLDSWLKEQRKYGTGNPVIALVASKVKAAFV